MPQWIVRISLLVVLVSGCAAETPPESAEERSAALPSIALIGATARSGKEIARQALARGHRVTGLARTPSKMEFEHENLTLGSGDVRDQASLEAALTGDEIVVSMVGYGTPEDPMAEIGEVDLYSVMARNLVSAMRKRGNTLLIIASSTGVEHRVAPDSPPPPPGDLTAGWRWNARHLYHDMFEMEEHIRASGLDYILLRPGFLTDAPARGDIKTTTDGNTPGARVITYADFAGFILDNLTDSEYLNQAVGLYSDTVMNPAAELEKVMGKRPE